MKTVAIGAVAFALALKAHAQDITSLPVCAVSEHSSKQNA